MKRPIIAIDLGLKRIGLACSTDGRLATPLPAVIRKNRNQAAADVNKVLQSWNAAQLVVGIPIGGASEAEIRRRVEHFLGLMDLNLPVFFQDESDTSIEAEQMMRGEIAYRRDGRVDSLAAMIILQRWLDGFAK